MKTAFHIIKCVVYLYFRTVMESEHNTKHMMNTRKHLLFQYMQATKVCMIVKGVLGSLFFKDVEK